MNPGERYLASEPITIHAAESVTSLEVTNTGDREIWIGSHFPFFEVNRALRFDRALAWGRRLAVPAGDCLRFPPGETVTVELVDFSGRRRVVGFNGLTAGEAVPERLDAALGRARARGYQDLGERP